MYSPLGVKGFRACLRFLDEAERYLSGRRKTLPTLTKVLRDAVPHGAIREAAIAPDGSVNVVFEDADRNEERKPRKFDPLYFVALLLLTVPGGSFRFNDSSKGKSEGKVPEDRRLFLSFGRGANQNIRLLRIIYDASPGFQIHRIHSAENRRFHYDHRKSVLKEVGDQEVRNAKRRARHSDRGRNHAIETACKHLELRLAQNAAALSNLKLNSESFRSLLQRAFRLADKLHIALNDGA